MQNKNLDLATLQDRSDRACNDGEISLFDPKSK